MPSLWHLPTTNTTPPDRRATHSRLARWFDTDNHHANRKAWNWTARPDSGGIDIGLLDDRLTTTLIRHAPADLTLLAATTWDQLGNDPPPPTTWRVRFISPVTFRHGNHLRPHTTPAAVLGCLRASWRNFRPPHIADLTMDLRTDPVTATVLDRQRVVEQFVLHDRRAAGSQTPIPVTITAGGFIGRIDYTIAGPIDPSAVASLSPSPPTPASAPTPPAVSVAPAPFHYTEQAIPTQRSTSHHACKPTTSTNDPPDTTNPGHTERNERTRAIPRQTRSTHHATISQGTQLPDAQGRIETFPSRSVRRGPVVEEPSCLTPKGV